jgi:hypothetical protein
MTLESRTVAAFLLALTASLPSRAADDPKVTVFSEGQQTLAMIEGCNSSCLNRVANVEEKGLLLFKVKRHHGILPSWFRLRDPGDAVVKDLPGEVICERFASHPKSWTDEEISAMANQILSQGCAIPKVFFSGFKFPLPTILFWFSVSACGSNVHEQGVLGRVLRGDNRI